MGKGLEIMFCYAHEDDELRQGLERQLIPLKRQGLITLWYDQEISPGAEWKSEIDKHLKTAHIILLLVSSAFLNSEYCYSIEMKQALERHQQGEARVIPIILRPTLWQGTPLGELQALPTGAVPVTDPGWHDLEKAYLNVAQGIQRVVEELNAGSRTENEETHHAKIGEFARIESPDLTNLPVMIQALDNQWLPRSYLNAVMQTGYLVPDLDKQRAKLARSEYIRALLNSQQLIIPIHYIYNNYVIYQDYLYRGRKREAFQKLLESGVIVPYLFTEKTPIDQPSFNLDVPGWEAWRQLCQETYMHCLRLSWDEKENEALTRQLLTRPLSSFALSAPSGDIDTYLQDLNLDQSVKDHFRQRLIEMARFCLAFSEQGKVVTRNDLYRAFVIEGGNPADREYDSLKPFAGEIKQLIDLCYNCALSDALNGYLITPFDSLPRTALQEYVSRGRFKQITGEELLGLLRRVGFDPVGRRLNLQSIDTLSLQDVYEVRRMGAWTSYLQSLQELLWNPLNFPDGGAAKVYANYDQLTQKITNLVAGREGREEVLVSWLPTIELVFYIGSATLACVWTRQGPTYRLSGQVTKGIAGDTVPVTGQLVIRDRADKQLRQDLSTRIDFARFQLRDASKQWEEITRQVKEYSGYLETDTALSFTDPVLNYRLNME